MLLTLAGDGGFLRVPQMDKRTALLAKLKAFVCHRSQRVGEVIQIINPILRRWVNYFAVGNASRCFSYVRTWVERKVRRHLARSRQIPRLRLEEVE